MATRNEPTGDFKMSRKIKYEVWLERERRFISKNVKKIKTGDIFQIRLRDGELFKNKYGRDKFRAIASPIQDPVTKNYDVPSVSLEKEKVDA
jgi:hypothetical protein